jgi:hypothetical protein
LKSSSTQKSVGVIMTRVCFIAAARSTICVHRDPYDPPNQR